MATKKKSPGDSPNACNKCRCERYFNILSIWVKKENEKKSSNQLTSTCSPHTNSWWLHETCLPQALFHRGSKHHDSDLTEKQTKLTKVPVSALDCNNFLKINSFYWSSAILPFTYLQQVISQISDLLNKYFWGDKTKNMCLKEIK